MFPREDEQLLQGQKWISWKKPGRCNWFKRGWVVQEAALVREAVTYVYPRRTLRCIDQYSPNLRTAASKRAQFNTDRQVAHNANRSSPDIAKDLRNVKTTGNEPWNKLIPNKTQVTKPYANSRGTELRRDVGLIGFKRQHLRIHVDH